MSKRCLAVSLALALTLLPATRAAAHCPGELGAPYLETTFAPIRPGGQPINLARVADGLTAPLKGTVAPGQPNRLYVVDQAGILWAVNLTTGDKTVFLDVGRRAQPARDPRRPRPQHLRRARLPGHGVPPQLRDRTASSTPTRRSPNGGPPTFPTTIPRGHHGRPPERGRRMAGRNPGNPAVGVDPASRAS